MKTITINQLDLNELRGIITHSIREAIEANIPKKPDELGYYLTRTEVSELLKVSRQTLATWAKSGELKCLKIGHHYRYRKSDINTFLNKQKTL